MADTLLPLKGGLVVREADLAERFIQTGGPGGQNVNKLATGVQLRYAPRAAGTLPERVLIRLDEIAKNRMNAEGEIIISATRFRSQEKNRADARERLAALITEAAEPPPKKRKPTRPTLGSQKRRLEKKTQRGTTKKLRGKVSLD